jgi:HPt (histidine-containing phosphotransfer) domain-containing protein
MSQKTSKSCTPPARDDFAQLSDAFYTRLRSDRVQFVTLSAALARAEDDPRQTFEDLRFRAHKLNGAAGIFDANEVMQAADALEQAAVRALQCHADNSDDNVWNTLQSLVNLLGNSEYADIGSD